MKPVDSRMNGASEDKAGGLKGFWEEINVMEFVFETALYVEVDLTHSKGDPFSSPLLPRQAIARSSGLPQTWSHL